jgi:hypothetical protein
MMGQQDSRLELMKLPWPKLLISLGALVLLVVRFIWFGHQIDGITLGLFVIAVLPWFSELIQSLEYGGLKIQFRDIQARQEQQQSEINTLKFLISHFVTGAEFEHLKKLRAGESLLFDTSSDTWPYLQKDLRRLRDFGLINNYPNRGIRSMERQKQGNTENYFFITKAGKDYLELRTQVDSQTSAQNDDS